MKARVIPVNVELDARIDSAVNEWAQREDRSKRRQIAVLIRKLVSLRDTNAEDLRRLGLIETRED